jgi:hypothetical protein
MKNANTADTCIIECVYCGAKSTVANAVGWAELEGDNYCSHCIAELERASKEDPERNSNN